MKWVGMSLLTLFFFSKIVLTVLFPLFFLIYLTISFPIATKTIFLDFDYSSIEFIDQIKNWNLNNTKYSNFDQNISLHLFNFSFCKWFLFFSIIVGLQCPLNFYCIAKWPSHTYVYILFLTLSSIMFHCKWLDRVPCAIQQDLIVYPFQRQ